MADFYQIPTPTNMSKTSEEYLRWEKLNFILRQLFDMVGNADGRLGPIGFKDSLNMGGNPITNGPVMTTAKDTDFVTKSWFKTAEFGKMAVSLISSSGKTPLSITGSSGVPQSGGGGGGGGAVSTTAPLSGGGTPPITISIPKATGAVDGYLSATDWTTFNGKQSALSFGNLTETTSSVLTIVGGTGSVIGSGTTIQVKKATAAVDGYLAAADFTTFAAKVSTALTISTTLPLTGGGDLSTNRTFAINDFTGDSGTGGLKGAVPAPASGDAASGKFLKANGSWAVPPAGGSASASYLYQSTAPANAGTSDRFYTDRAGTIQWVMGGVVKGDGIVTTNLDVLLNGVSIYPSSAKPSVSAGQYVGAHAVPDTVSFNAGDYFQIVTSSTGGTNGAIRCYIYFS